MTRLKRAIGTFDAGQGWACRTWLFHPEWTDHAIEGFMQGRSFYGYGPLIELEIEEASEAV